MKSNMKTRQAADLVDVRRNGDGVTYKCLRCGLEMKSNVYYEPTYKSMLNHAATCDGTRMDIVAVQPQQMDIAALNDYTKLMADHIKACVPNGADLSNTEALALARISMATDLSPFTGELYYLHGKGPHIGIRGLRRKAKEQALYSLNTRPMTPAEVEEHDVRPCDTGYICELWRHDRTKEAAEINRLAKQAIIPIMPVMGVGIWRKAYKEIAQYKDDPIPHGKSPAWVAKKRAEADALNQAYDIGIKLPYSDAADDYIEFANGGDDWEIVQDDEETLRRQVAMNAERAAQVDIVQPSKDGTLGAVVDKYATEDFADIITAYKSGQRPLPAWAEELRQEISQDPKVSDPIGKDWIDKLLAAAEGKGLSRARFEAFIQIALGHLIEELTFGEVRVLKAHLDNDLTDQVAELLTS